MQLLMASIVSTGKLVGHGLESCFLQLLTVTDVFADMTARVVLQEKQLTRAVRLIKLVHETLSYLDITSAQERCDRRGLPWIDTNTEQELKELPHTF